MNITQFQPKAVSKIAFLNPYLQGGHLETAEIESAARLVQAARNLSIEVRVFDGCEEIEFFDPDFVITISFQAPKLTSYPTYGLMDVPTSLIKDVPRFVRNVLSYDGYLTISKSVENWLLQLCSNNNKKMHLSHSAFSVQKTTYSSPKFQESFAMYIGTNWDGARHAELFNLLSSGEYLKCYGPEKKWMHYPKSLYSGPIPFDGISVLNAYNQAGIGLCIGHPVFDAEGVPSSRTFEIAAAHALPICSNIELNRRIFGDAALYVDIDATTQQLAEQIIEHVKWVRNNPTLAQEMARHAYDIFSKKLSMEYYLNNLIEMHNRVLYENNYLPTMDSFASQPINNTVPVNPKITYIIAVKHADYRLQPLLSNLINQTYENIDVILLAQNAVSIFNTHFMGLDLTKLNIIPIPYHGVMTNVEILSCLQRNKTEWFTVLTDNDRIFSNHSATLINHYRANRETLLDKKIMGLSSGSVEFSHSMHLPEHLIDEHRVVNQNRLRLAPANVDVSMPLNTILIEFGLFDLGLFQQLNFYDLSSKPLVESILNRGEFLRVSEITSSRLVDEFEDVTFLQSKVVKLDLQLADYKKIIHHKEQEINNIQHQLISIHSSVSWKLVSIIRKIKKIILFPYYKLKPSN